MSDKRPTIEVHAEVPTPDAVRTFYEVPDAVASQIGVLDHKASFVENLVSLLAGKAYAVEAVNVAAIHHVEKMRDLRDQHNSETRKDCESGCDTHRTCREDRGPCTHGLTAGRGTAERCLECGEAVTEPRPENPYRTVHARMSPPGAAWDEGFAAGRAAATPDPPDPRLDAVYAERNAVVLGLAKAGLMLGWRVGKASDPNEPDWPVVYIDTPAGQVSWHFRAADVPDWVEPYPGEWDRHSDREKYERLSRLPTAPAASPDERLREAAGLLSRAKTALRAHRLNWLALSDRLDAPYPDRPDSSPWSRFALPVCQRGKAVEDEIVAALAAADREAPDEGLSSVRGATFYHAVCLGCGESPDEDGAEWRATPHEAAEVATEHGWRDGRCEECQPAIDEPKETTT